MKNWDDNTEEIFTIKVDKKELNNNITYLTHQNLNTEKWKCEVLKNGKEYGTPNFYDNREQVVAWIRLMLGDYADCYRGVS